MVIYGQVASGVYRDGHLSSRVFLHARDARPRGDRATVPPNEEAVSWQPHRPEWQPSATVHQCCVDIQAIAALTARAASGVGCTPSRSPKEDGGKAEGRTPFVAMSADSRGGFKARRHADKLP